MRGKPAAAPGSTASSILAFLQPIGATSNKEFAEFRATRDVWMMDIPAENRRAIARVQGGLRREEGLRRRGGKGGDWGQCISDVYFRLGKLRNLAGAMCVS